MFFFYDPFLLRCCNDTDAERLRQIKQRAFPGCVVALQMFLPHFPCHRQSENRLRAVDAVTTSQGNACLTAHMATSLQNTFSDLRCDFIDRPPEYSDGHKWLA